MTETTILAAYGLLVLLTIILQATGSMQQLTLGYLLSSRDEGRTVTGMALFAPAILILVISDRTSGQTLLAAQVFLVARIIYLPSYMFGITGVRTASWFAGFAATAILYFLAL
jgi:hypothetical protein